MRIPHLVAMSKHPICMYAYKLRVFVLFADSRYDSGRRLTIGGKVVNVVHMKLDKKCPTYQRPIREIATYPPDKAYLPVKNDITSKQEHAGDKHVVNDTVSIHTRCPTYQRPIRGVVTYPPEKAYLPVKNDITNKQEHAGDKHVVNDTVSIPTRCPTYQRPIRGVVTYSPDKAYLPVKNDITSKQEHAGDKHVVNDTVSIPTRCPTDQNQITVVTCFPTEKAYLLEMLLPGIQSSLPNCSLKRVPQGIALTATPDCVSQARLAVAEQVFNFVGHAISGVDSQRAKLLLSDRGQKLFQDLFSKAGIQAVVSVRDDQPWLTATDSHQNSVASKVLEKNIHKFGIPVADVQQKYLQSAECKQLIEDLENKHMVTVEQEQSTLVIEALGDCGDEVMAVLREALDANAQQTEDIVVAVDDWKLLSDHYQADIDALRRNTVDK